MYYIESLHKTNILDRNLWDVLLVRLVRQLKHNSRVCIQTLTVSVLCAYIDD